MPRGVPDPRNLPLRLRRARKRLFLWEAERGSPSHSFRHEDNVLVCRQLREEIAMLEPLVLAMEAADAR